MKLDSIIYDAGTLSTTITEKLVEESPTFTALYPSETSTSLVDTLSAYGAMLQYSLVSAMANCYTDTAYSPTGIYQLAETLGNRLHGNIASQVRCNIRRENFLGESNIVIPANCEFRIKGIRFFNPDNIVFPISIDKIFDVKLVQGELVTIEKISNGLADEKIYFSSDFKCDMSYVRVYVNGVEWSTEETFLPLNSNNLVDSSQVQSVILRTDPDGRAYIKFGNASNGAIPTTGDNIKIVYVSNDGTKGNIEESDVLVQLMTPIYIFNQNTGTEELLRVDITDSTIGVGGSDMQDLETLKATSPFIFASGNRAVRRDDYNAMLLNKCGYKTANVWGEYEQAAMNGGYDKIMMNMVYYTGIKSIQKYDYKPIGDLITVRKITNDAPIIVSNVLGSSRGFIGSYEIEINYTLNIQNKIRYVDKSGNGILTYNISDNVKTTGDSEYIYYTYNDLLESYETGVMTVAGLTSRQPVEPNSSENVLYGLNQGLVSTGKRNYSDVTPFLISYDNPFQIEITFNQEMPLAALLFRAEHEHKDNFLGKFAVYATNDSNPDYSNIKNSDKWIRLCDLQQINFEIENGWSDWVTLNTFQPQNVDNIWRKYKKYVIEIYSLFGTDNITPGDKLYIQQIKGMFGYNDTNYQAYNGSNGKTYYLRARFNDTVKETDKVFMKEEVYVQRGSIIRISTEEPHVITAKVQDGGIETEITLSRNNNLDETISHKMSTIDYNNNNLVELCIPSLPSSMHYYAYEVDIQGLNADNKYSVGDIVSYYDENSNKYFNIRVDNIYTGKYTVYLENDPETINNIELGDDFVIETTNAPLKYMGDSRPGKGEGATITIKSQSGLHSYGNFVGNAYSTNEIELADRSIIEKYNHFTTYMEFVQPRIKNTQITVKLAYEDVTTAKDVRNNVIEAIHQLFELKPYSLGRTLNLADIWKAINNVKGVSHFVITNPTNNISCEQYELIMLPESNLSIIDESLYEIQKNTGYKVHG